MFHPYSTTLQNQQAPGCKSESGPPLYSSIFSLWAHLWSSWYPFPLWILIRSLCSSETSALHFKFGRALFRFFISSHLKCPELLITLTVHSVLEHYIPRICWRDRLARTHTDTHTQTQRHMCTHPIHPHPARLWVHACLICAKLRGSI